MAKLFTNAARAELASGLSSGATSFSISSGGAQFPVANTGSSAISSAADWFKLVIQDTGNFEIVYVRTHSSGSNTFSNVLRAQEGTTARAFAAASVVGMRITATDATEWERGSLAPYDFSQSGNFTAEAGKGYWLANDYTVTLPDTTSLPLGTMVQFMKSLTATPTIQVGSGGAVIQTAKGSDTSVVMDVDAELTFVFNGTNWEV